MKKLIILPLLFIGLLSWAQSQFIVQNGTKTEVYSTIDNAITNAVTGDTLYIPGGGFALSNTTIDKTLHWVGHGHYPAATGATMQSRITTALTFTGNCDNSSFEGIYFTSTLNFGSNDDEATNIWIKRCRIGGALSLRAVATGNPTLNFNIIECITGQINGNNADLCYIRKTMIFGLVLNFFNSYFINSSINKWISASTNDKSVLRGCVSCTFSNTVFSSRGGLNSNTQSCFFYNNLFAEALPYNEVSTQTGSNNIVSVGQENIYVSSSAASDNHVFSYDKDYHLKAGSAGINGGTDGTNIGIYGTLNPYKTYAIPYYPHINTANVANEAVNNELGIQINVQSQER